MINSWGSSYPISSQGLKGAAFPKEFFLCNELQICLLYIFNHVMFLGLFLKSGATIERIFFGDLQHCTFFFLLINEFLSVRCTP